MGDRRSARSCSPSDWPRCCRDYWLLIATSVLVAMMSLIGLGIVTGTAGMIALCQLSFAAVGGWVLDFLMTQTPLYPRLGGVAFIVAMIVGAFAAAALGFVVGPASASPEGCESRGRDPGSRCRAGHDPSEGVVPRPVVERAGGPSVRHPRCLGSVGQQVLLPLRRRRGDHRRAVRCSSCREDGGARDGGLSRSRSEGTASTGTSVTSAKLSAFTVSAFIGGIAGGLIVGQVTTANYITFQTLNSLGLYVLAIAVGAHLLEMTLLGGMLFVLIPEILKQFRIPLEWSSIAFAALGIQALTTNSNFGNDIRNAIVRRRRRKGHTGRSRRSPRWNPSARLFRGRRSRCCSRWRTSPSASAPSSLFRM